LPALTSSLAETPLSWSRQIETDEQPTAVSSTIARSKRIIRLTAMELTGIFPAVFRGSPHLCCLSRVRGVVKLEVPL